jgi:hypothetical protein
VRRNLNLALELFERACAYFERNERLKAEIDWQRRATPESFNESDLLREAAWVILCGGFRESVVRRKFNYISLCFCDWECSELIITSAPVCRAGALAAIGNARKIDAIVGVARKVNDWGFVRFKSEILCNPIASLRKLPFIGPITVWHLAKNLGFRVAKPDRHLARLSRFLGFADAHELCDVIAQSVCEGINVVDLVLWRYAADGFPLLNSSIAQQMASRTSLRLLPVQGRFRCHPRAEDARAT